MATKTLTVSENVSYICFPPLNAKTVKGKLAFDCPVVHLYFGFTPTFDIEPKKMTVSEEETVILLIFDIF